MLVRWFERLSVTAGLIPVLGKGIVFSILLATNASAQSGLPNQAVSGTSDGMERLSDLDTITFKVSARGTGVAISKAEIRVDGKTIFSDGTGTAIIEIPKTGDGTVTIYRKGFERLEVKYVQLRPPGEFDVRLYPSVTDDEVIIVRGKKSNAISRTTVSIEEASKVAPGGDPAQVVRLLPGVQSAGGPGGGGGRGGRGGGGGGSQVVIQGSGPHDSRYYIDDLEVPFIFHGFGNLSVIPGGMLQSVEFESAGFGTEFGDATGGIITLRTVDEIPERPKTSFVVNLPFYSGVLHTRPLSETSSLTVGVRRSYIDVILKQYMNSQNDSPNAGATIAPYFSDGEVQYLKKNDDGHTKVTMLGAYDGIRAVLPAGAFSSSGGNISALTTFADVGVEREQRLTKDWKYVSTPQFYFYRNTANFGDMDSESSSEKFRIPTQLTKRLDRNENLYFGVDPSYTTANTSLYAPRLQADDPTFDREDAPLVKTVDTEKYASIAAWTSVDQSVGGLLLTPGVRTAYNGQIKKTTADPRLRSRYALTERTSLKGAVGQYSESPQPLEAAPERGNPDLNFIRSYHYTLGVDTSWSETWNSDISVYYKTAKDLVRSDPEKNYINDGSMRSRGFMAMIRRNSTGRLFGWLSYTYSKTEERPSSTAPWRTATYDQTHVLTLVGNYKITGTWDAGGRYDYHTGNTYDIVNDAVYNANLDKYDGRPEDSDINGGRTPATQTVTAYFTHDFLRDTWKLAMRFGVEQYWFEPQVYGVRYNYNYSKTEETTALTTVPFFELKGDF
jgi:hypothetical protein